jgi:tripartite-type tricarboxylate transporter receptor subunit TctC
MKVSRRKLIVSSGLSASLGVLSTHVRAQAFPTRPIKIVVNFAAGGTSDVMARALARSMSTTLGQQVVIENRTGALGAVGAAAVARSAPDGYTVLLTTQGSLTEIPVISPQTPYDPLTAFVPITLVGESPFVLFAHPDFPANNVRELVQYAKAQPNGVDISVTGSSVKLCTYALQGAAGIKLVHIPYGGTGPAVNAAIAGHTKLSLNTVTSAMLENVKAGKLKFLGVGTPKPYRLLPGVAPIGDTLPGYTATVWWAVFAPGGTPADIVARLNRAFKQALADPANEEIFTSNAVLALESTPEELGRRVTEGIATTRKLVSAYNIPTE